MVQKKDSGALSIDLQKQKKIFSVLHCNKVRKIFKYKNGKDGVFSIHFLLHYITKLRKMTRSSVRSSKASAARQALHNSVVLKRELSRKAKLSLFKSVFVPILTYSNESWLITERMRSYMPASKMRFLKKIE